MTSSLASTGAIFRALAHEARLRLLNLLLEGEVCVCHLCAVLDVAQPNVSRHLAYLHRAALVTVRQQGKWKYYAIPKRRIGLRRPFSMTASEPPVQTTGLKPARFQEHLGVCGNRDAARASGPQSLGHCPMFLADRDLCPGAAPP